MNTLLPAFSLRHHSAAAACVASTTPAALDNGPTVRHIATAAPTARRRVGPYSAVLIASALAACATTPIGPTPEMTRAEAAIDQAQRAGAADYASEPLQSARHRLDEAKAAAAKGDAVRAQALVEESSADAHLADLTAQSGKATKAAVEVDKSIGTLQSEADRKLPQ